MSTQMFRKIPCKAKKKNGGPCSAFTVPGSDFCNMHHTYGSNLPVEPVELPSPTKKKTGRPPIHTEEKWEAILEEIRSGKEKVEACRIVGVPYTAFRSKCRNDAEYAELVKVAYQVEGALIFENTLAAASLNGHVQATKMILSARNYEKWGDKPTMIVQDERPFDRDALIGNIINLALELSKRRGESPAIDVEAIEPLALPEAAVEAK